MGKRQFKSLLLIGLALSTVLCVIIFGQKSDNTLASVENRPPCMVLGTCSDFQNPLDTQKIFESSNGLVEPLRIRSPYTPENRPEGQPSCDCPFDIANDWSICGGRSAYAKTGGREPICYEGESEPRQLWYYSEETRKVDRERQGR